MTKKFILPATLLLAFSQLFSRILGIVRDRVFANIFGIGGEGIWNLDAYFAAFRLPDLVYNLLIFGTLSAAFVPLLAEKKSDEAGKFASNTLNVLLFLVLLVSCGIFISARPLSEVLLPGFGAEEINLTAQLLRIQLLAPIFFTASGIFGGFAQHARRFFYYSLAPIFYNAGIILATVFWGGEFGVFAASWGVAGGAGLHAAAQFFGARNSGFRWQPIFDFGKLRKFFRLALPRVLAVGAAQFQQVAIVFFASVSAGALAAFNFAWNLASLPLGVVGIAFATTSFAELSKLSDSAGKFIKTLHRNFFGVIFWTLPAAIGLFFLRNEITNLILTSGKFDNAAGNRVAEMLGWLAVGVPFVSLWPLLQNSFFAKKMTRIPLAASVLALGVVTLLAEKIGVAAAFSAANFAGVVLLFLFLPRGFWRLDWRRLVKIIFVAMLLGALIYFLQDWWVAKNGLELIWKVGGVSTIGAAFYLTTMKVLSR